MRGQAELLTQVTGVFKLSEEQASRLNRRRDPARDVKVMATESAPMRPPQKEWMHRQYNQPGRVARQRLRTSRRRQKTVSGKNFDSHTP